MAAIQTLSHGLPLNLLDDMSNSLPEYPNSSLMEGQLRDDVLLQWDDEM